MKTAIRIIIVDDHPLVLKSWKEILENHPPFELLACCRDSAEALKKLEEALPDVILIDLKKGPFNGFELTSRISKEYPAVRIIGLSMNNQPNYAKKMVDCGAMGFLTKTSSPEEIYRGITEVFEGRSYVCEEIRNSKDWRFYFKDDSREKQKK